METTDVVVALLAAGKAERFGSNKLLAKIGGVPMGERVATALSHLGARRCYAITNCDSVDYSYLGFEMIRNDNPDLGQSHSLHLAVNAALHTDAKALLVALADMPYVPLTHFETLISETDDDVIASFNGEHSMPPAIFPRRFWPQLLKTRGDIGARQLLTAEKRIQASCDWLRDVDTPADLPTSK